VIELSNRELVVTVLDPVTDRDRMGPRYCSGGYIYQVADASVGPLLSGPGYPAEDPPPIFDGQGLPESFRTPLIPSQSQDGAEHKALHLGVGLVDTASRTVSDWCDWQIDRRADALLLSTRHDFAGWSIELERRVILRERSLVSATRLANVGQAAFLLDWYPHPFFPLTPNGVCCRFSCQVSVQENPGYTLRADGFVRRKLDHSWDRRGHYLVVDLPAGEQLTVLQRHPKLGLVVTTCNYPTAFVPIWGNCNTFSFEPYYQRTVSGGQSVEWSVRYDF
jgi:hypothetical protein